MDKSRVRERIIRIEQHFWFGGDGFCLGRGATIWVDFTPDQPRNGKKTRLKR